MQTHGAMDGRGQNALVTGGQTFCWRKQENRGVELSKGQQPAARGLESTLQLTAGIPFNKKIQLFCFYCCCCGCCCCVFISSDTMQKASDCQDLRINNEYRPSAMATATTQLATSLRSINSQRKYLESNTDCKKKRRNIQKLEARIN